MLPAADDRVAALIDRACEALRKVGRRCRGFEFLDLVDEGHLVHARDAARIEVVLEEFPRIGVEADDRDAVSGVGIIELSALNEEACVP
jgi:hypothetical protein